MGVLAALRSFMGMHRETTARVGFELHRLGFSGPHRDRDVVALEMHGEGAVRGPLDAQARVLRRAQYALRAWYRAVADFDRDCLRLRRGGRRDENGSRGDESAPNQRPRTSWAAESFSTARIAFFGTAASKPAAWYWL